EVAARYQPPWTILDPADSTSFLRAAVIGAGVLLLLGAFTTGILAWLGVLLVGFAAKNWIHRLWPATARWQPRDRDRTNRVGSAVVVLIATPFVVLYAAPTWVLEQVSGGRLDTSWAAYTEDFRQWRLPCFIGLLAGLLALLSFVAAQGRWSRLTRRLNIGL